MVVAEGGWQHPRPTGLQLPEMWPTPMGDGLLLSLPSSEDRLTLRHLWLGPERAELETARAPAGLQFCGPTPWGPDGLRLARMTSASVYDCRGLQTEASLAVIEAERYFGQLNAELAAVASAGDQKLARPMGR